MTLPISANTYLEQLKKLNKIYYKKRRTEPDDYFIILPRYSAGDNYKFITYEGR
jgi:hypothetical protein